MLSGVWLMPSLDVKEIMVVLYFLDSLKSKDRVEKY
jgi:hypothetical protein